MPDIKKQIRNPETTSPETIDQQHELAGWNREIAERVAAEEGVTMTDAHWEVVDFLRKNYLEHGSALSGRELAKVLDEAFSEHGGSRYLHQLFVKGPVAQGSRIGGLSLPPYTGDESFGSAM
ncbi:MAG: TusE/DsrC/DsvC family sulfur relay protein [Thiobacillus sp.]|jgi:tRNA 2-thiouridine synthesizing protein E